MVKIDWRPERGKLRSFGGVGFLVFGALAAVVHFRGHIFGFDLAAATAERVALGLVVLAIACGAFALVAPSVLRPLYVGLMIVTYPIGLVVSELILIVIYGLVFTPAALVMRAMGRDPMHRKLERSATTYWTPRTQAEASRYLRQH